MRAKVWTNPTLGKHVATPDDGPYADEAYGLGDTDEEALANLDTVIQEREAENAANGRTEDGA